MPRILTCDTDEVRRLEMHVRNAINKADQAAEGEHLQVRYRLKVIQGLLGEVRDQIYALQYGTRFRNAAPVQTHSATKKADA